VVIKLANRLQAHLPTLASWVEQEELVTFLPRMGI